jgi:hypothetical protein
VPNARAPTQHSDNNDTANVATPVSLPGGSKCELVWQDGRTRAECLPLFAATLPQEPECNKLLMPRHTNVLTCSATNVGGHRACTNRRTGDDNCEQLQHMADDVHGPCADADRLLSAVGD